MLDSYRRVFAHPGSLAFSSTGIVARLPMSMMTLGIVILVSEQSGSYALAGQVAAAYVIGNAALALVQGRAADRFGQTVVLWVDAILFAATTGLLVRSVTDGWANPWPHVLAALAGASMPQIGSMVRARWADLATDDTERHTAFAVEAVGDEMVFVAGPTVVTFLSTIYAPQTGLVVAVVVGTIGTVLLALQRRTVPPGHRHAEHGPDPLPWDALIPIGTVAIFLGTLFGALEVATVAVAEDAGHKSASGLLLTVFSLGSMAAGLVAGATTWKRSPLQRVRIGVALLAGALFVLPFLDDLVLLGVVLLVVGTTLAPTLIAGVTLLEASTPRSRLTEAMAVFQTGISAGLAPGAYVAGLVADHTTGASTYWVCAVAGVFSTVATLACKPAPARRDDESAVSVD
ncbi:MFS transporter [Marmoricola sp. RAF53]|uniref:MFS transporter n=1 Tax=Marmoricola sp. RAF53 TaxID=3233059 RepID=UPI003F9E8FE9